MTSLALALCSFFLLLALLLPQVLSASILNLDPHHPVPVAPDANNPTFRKIILDKVNTYRSYQDASALEYDASLANYAAGLANQCDIESKVDGPLGDIPYCRAADLIEGWYDANASYIADPTFQIVPFGRSYTQLVWKATTAIGCAWTPATCKFDSSSAFYLRCAFSPKGNIKGQFEDNVSCNGCTNHGQSGLQQSLQIWKERQSTGFAFWNICLAQVNRMRAQAGVNSVGCDNNGAEALAKTFAQKCNGSPQQGEIVGPAVAGPPEYIPTWEATLQALHAWDQEPHTTDLVKSPNYARITSKDVSFFGCGWNENICPSGKWYMHCFFGNFDFDGAAPQIKERQMEENSISAQQSGDLGVNMDDYSVSLMGAINGIRKNASLPEVNWSHSLVASTHDRGAGCSDFRSLSLSQLVSNHFWPTILNPKPDFYLLSSAAGWNSTKPAPGLYDQTSHELDYYKIAQPQWRSVGCSWSRNCTAADFYILYCELSDSSPTRRAVEEDQAIRPPTDSWLQNTIGQAFADARAQAGVVDHPEIYFDETEATDAQTTVDRCDGTKTDSPHGPAKIFYRYDEARGKLTKEEMTINAIAEWIMQGTSPDVNARSAYLTITDAGKKRFGCAWSMKCGSIHYLYGSFYPPQ